ncbi:MAG: flagellar basal body-associated FliL family protein [bacterium]|nr:flagellar basal body-associated FliL family protein [bacterium]
MPNGEEKEEKEKKPLLRLPIIRILLGVIGLIILVFIMIFIARMVGKAGPKPIEVGRPWEELEEKKVPPPKALKIWALTSGEEAIIANLGGDVVETHLVRVTQINLAYEEKYKALATELATPGRTAQIKDLFNTVLSTKASEDFITEEGNRAVKDELIERINAILCEGQIKDIYWQLVVQ